MYKRQTEHYGKAFLLKIVAGPNLSPMPYLAYGLVGAIIGIGLARRVPATLMRRYGYGFASILVTCGVIALLLTGFSPVELALHPLPFKLHCINLGLMLACCTWLVLFMEYCTEEKRQRIASRTLWLRRVGLMALTLFCLESFGAVLFSKGYMWLLDIGGAFPRSPIYIVPFLAFILTFWNIMLILWEKADFAFSVEWWLSRLVCWVRARPTVRLQAQEVLHKPCYPSAVVPEPIPVVTE